MAGGGLAKGLGGRCICCDAPGVSHPPWYQVGLDVAALWWVSISDTSIGGVSFNLKRPVNLSLFNCQPFTRRALTSGGNT